MWPAVPPAAGDIGPTSDSLASGTSRTDLTQERCHRGGVKARIATPRNGSGLGACDYTTDTIRLTAEVRVKDPSLSPDEYVKAGTYGQGRVLRGLGDAAAVAELDHGRGQLVLVKKGIALFLIGDTEITGSLAKVAEEAVHALPYRPS